LQLLNKFSPASLFHKGCCGQESCSHWSRIICRFRRWNILQIQIVSDRHRSLQLSKLSATTRGGTCNYDYRADSGKIISGCIFFHNPRQYPFKRPIRVVWHACETRKIHLCIYKLHSDNSGSSRIITRGSTRSSTCFSRRCGWRDAGNGTRRGARTNTTVSSAVSPSTLAGVSASIIYIENAFAVIHALVLITHRSIAVVSAVSPSTLAGVSAFFSIIENAFAVIHALVRITHRSIAVVSAVSLSTLAGVSASFSIIENAFAVIHALVRITRPSIAVSSAVSLRALAGVSASFIVIGNAGTVIHALVRITHPRQFTRCLFNSGCTGSRIASSAEQMNVLGYHFAVVRPGGFIHSTKIGYCSKRGRLQSRKKIYSGRIEGDLSNKESKDSKFTFNHCRVPSRRVLLERFPVRQRLKWSLEYASRLLLGPLPPRIHHPQLDHGVRSVVGNDVMWVRQRKP
jgi:hypothetical protein